MATLHTPHKIKRIRKKSYGNIKKKEKSNVSQKHNDSILEIEMLVHSMPKKKGPSSVFGNQNPQLYRSVIEPEMMSVEIAEDLYMKKYNASFQSNNLLEDKSDDNVSNK